MTSELLLPTNEEVEKWMLATLRHSQHVEYFIERLGGGAYFDPERPHDLVGVGNKFDWDVIKGFALQYRDPKVDFKTYIEPALVLHREQYHHRMWNNPDPNDITKKIPEADYHDMTLGAIDAVCSLLENRAYQGGSHDYDSAEAVARKNPPHKIKWMVDTIHAMRAWIEYSKKMERPKIERITSLEDFPNIGVNPITYNRTKKRTSETIEMLRTKGYEIGGPRTKVQL